MANPTTAQQAANESPTSEDPDLDFDEPLGAAQGVVAFSNLDDYFFSGEPAYTFGVYTGYKYQCVEYSRRYMMLRQKCCFRQCGPAAELFGHTVVDNIETGEEFKWVACENKTTTVKPAVGMTLIYRISKKMPVGHVATISYVADGFVGIAEQNQASKAWNGKPYGRLVPLEQTEDGAWYLRETDPALDDSHGWLYIDGVDFEEPLEDKRSEEVLSNLNDDTLGLTVYRPPNVLEKFIAPQSTAKKLARFSTKPRIPTAPTFDYAACQEARATRKQLAETYLKTVDENFQRVREAAGDSAHHVTHNGHTFRRSGVARSAEWHSEYVPNEAVAIGGIGDGNRAFTLVKTCVNRVLNDVMTQPADAQAAFAARFGMSVEALSAAQRHLDASVATKALRTHASGDSMLGVLGLVHDYEVDCNRILHAELDSLNNVMDINGMQQAFGADLGRPNGWRMGGFGNDFNRALKCIQKLRVGRAEADLPLVFLDFGDVAALKEKHGFTFATEEEAYQYTIERLNSLYLAAMLCDLLKEKETDMKNGDLLEEDMPQWRVAVVEDALSHVAAAEDGAGLLVQGKAVSIAWKCCPWWALFQMKDRAVSGAKSILSAVYAQPSFGIVTQPLWTHVASHPAFLPLLAAWAAKHDATATDGEVATRHALPIATFPTAKADLGGAVTPADDLPPACTFRVQAFEGLTDPEHEGSEPRAPPRESTLAPATLFAPALHIVVAGSKRSATCCVEGRLAGSHSDHGTAGTGIYDVVHPAPMTIIRSVHWH